MLIVYLDRYNLGDPLFPDRFARDVAACRRPVVLVHGSGEAGELAIEATGREPSRENGVLVVESEAETALVERATRELNRRLVHALNEAGVPAMRVLGADRGVLKARRERPGGGIAHGEAGEEGGTEVPGAAWLLGLARQGAVPVLATLVAPAAEGSASELSGKPFAEVSAPLIEVDAASAAAALALAAPDDGTLVFLLKGRVQGLQGPRGPLATVALGTLGASAVLSEPDAVRRAHRVRPGQVILTAPGALAGSGPLTGTRVEGREGAEASRPESA